MGAVPTPLNEYAKSKARGEQVVRKHDARALILRTNFFAWGPTYRPSFSDWIINELRENRKIGLFGDVRFSPLIARNIVATAHRLLDHNLAGIYNVCADNLISKHDFGLLVAREFGLNEDLISEIALSDLAELVQRPRLMGLVNDKARQALGQGLGSVEDQISELKLTQFSPETMEVQEQ